MRSTSKGGLGRAGFLPWIALPSLLSLTACSALDTDVQRGYAANQRWTQGAVFTSGDVRVITQRKHPALGNEIVCAEPSPDIAKALSTAATASAAGGNGAANGSLSLSGSSAEAAAELAGRSTALLGLRDGLFRACEAYANGVLGQDAYALIIGRYTQLMTTLFLGQDITGAAGAEGKAAATSAVLQALGNQSSNTTPPAATPTTPATSTPSKTKASAESSTVTDPIIMPATFSTPTEATIDTLTPSASMFQLAATKAKPAVKKPTPAAPSPGGSTPSPNAPTDNTNTSNNPPNAQTASAAGVSTAAALALVRLNEDYMHQSLLDIIVVSCINEYDPTRYTASGDGNNNRNTWLIKICGKLNDIDELKSLTLMEAVSGWPPVNPEVAAVQLTPQIAGDATVKVVQTALQSQTCAGCNPGRNDGVFDAPNLAAVTAYQTFKQLPVNGNPFDSKMLASLGLPAPSAAAPAAKAASASSPKGRKS